MWGIVSAVAVRDLNGKAGIPSDPVPVFFPEKVMLLIGIGGGAESVDPDIAVPQGRTYWFQQ